MESGREWIEPDIFYGKDRGVCKFSPAFGLADMDPVGGLVTGALEPVDFNKCFHENRAVAIEHFPVGRKSFGSHGQEFGCEIFDVYPGQHEESGIVDDEVEIFSALFMAPADELVTRGYGPGSGTEAQQGNDGLIDPGHVAQLRTGQRGIAQIMIAVDVFPPELRVGGADHGLQA